MLRMNSSIGSVAILTLAFSVGGVSGAKARRSASTTSKAVWTAKAPLPVAMAEVGVAALNGKVYVIGGTRQAPNAAPEWASTLNMMYDPATNSWTARAPLPQGLSHVGVAALGGKIYAVGGFTDIIHMGPQSVVFAYDPTADSWSKVGSLSTSRGSVAVAAVDGKLHAFGGRQADEILKVPAPPGAPEMSQTRGTTTLHEIYDPAKKSWKVGAPIPGPGRDHLGIAVLNSKIHLFGGRVFDVVDNLDRHDVFDPRTGRWSIAAPLPLPRSAGASAVLDGRIIYAGGECKPGSRPFTPNTFDTVTAYDSTTNQWQILTPLPSGRHGFGGATIAKVSYFAAGAGLCGGGALTELLALTLTRP
jgi:N-acetylneuraminic acid mutarotase